MTHRVYGMAFLVVLALAVLAQAQTFTTLHSFTGGSDGGNPWAGVIQDAAGNPYGTAALGGFIYGGYNYNCGVVYQLNTAGTETVLYDFCPYGDYDTGAGPRAPVTLDSAGNLYGTTYYGGSLGYGAVFKLDTAGNETVLHSFTGSSDGCQPLQGLVLDGSGNVFGTTYQCFYAGIFKIDSAGTFTLLHTFGGFDGEYPQYGHLTMDTAGNLYGLTQYGGTDGNGVLYELSTRGTFTVLHSFKGGTKDGCYPYGSVVLDQHGNLYGTTSYCGSHNAGTIWKLSKKGKETTLHNFAGGTRDGCYPYGGVALDSQGNLYGATYSCGAHSYYGVLYKLSVRGKLTLLHSFDYAGGYYPTGEVWRNANGTLFGTTSEGGAGSYGTVWSYVP